MRNRTQRQSELSSGEFRSLVKAKFRSLSRFCEISGDNYQSLRNFLYKIERDGLTDRSRKRLQELNSQARILTNQILEEEISLQERKFIRAKCKEIAGSINEFAKLFPQFPKTTIFDIVLGKKRTKTDAFLELYDFLTNYSED